MQLYAMSAISRIPLLVFLGYTSRHCARTPCVARLVDAGGLRALRAAARCFVAPAERAVTRLQEPLRGRDTT